MGCFFFFLSGSPPPPEHLRRIPRETRVRHGGIGKTAGIRATDVPGLVREISAVCVGEGEIFQRFSKNRLRYTIVLSRDFLHRRSRTVRGGGAHAKRSGTGRPAQLGLSVFREPAPDGHTRVARVVRTLHRRLSVGPHTGLLLGRLPVRVQTHRVQREQVAHIGRRMESHVLQLQRNHSHRVSSRRGKRTAGAYWIQLLF